MRFIDADTVHRLLDYPALIKAIARTYAEPPEAPERAHYTIKTNGDAPDATLLLMSAWRSGDLLGVKSVTVFPGNADKGLPAVNGVYLLSDGATGVPLALIDGAALTLKRTAAVSALAADRLARPDAATLLMIGTGALAPELIAAHASVRAFTKIRIWGRNHEKAKALAGAIEMPGAVVEVAENLDEAVAAADVISTATLSEVPLVKGALVRPGSHVDLVGAYRPDMCEADSDLMAKARVFVDTRAGALSEAGEIVQAIASGAMVAGDIIADLPEIQTDAEDWQRQSAEEITAFKSVGSAISDFAAARLLWESFKGD